MSIHRNSPPPGATATRPLAPNARPLAAHEKKRANGPKATQTNIAGAGKAATLTAPKNVARIGGLHETVDALNAQELAVGLQKNAPNAFAKTHTPGLLFHAAQKLSAAPTKTSRVNLPDWVPASFNLQKAAETAKSILISQGADPATIGPGKVKSLIFTDADHTLIKTSTPVLLMNDKTGELLHHPKTGRVITLRGQGYREELEALQKEFPDLPWKNLNFDYSGMADPSEVHRSAPIKETLNAIADHQKRDDSRDFIITARSAGNIPAVFHEYMNDLGHDLHGTFPVNEPGLMQQFGFDQNPGLGTEHNKALTMAALIELYQPGGAQMDRVRFYEDADVNLQAAMDLLPKMFPSIRFEFFDVVHAGHEKFEHRLVASTDDNGVLKNAKTGFAMSDHDISHYESNDIKLPPPPEYYPPGARMNIQNTE